MAHYLALTIGGQRVAVPTDWEGPKVPDRFINPPPDATSSLINGALTGFLTAGVIAALIVIIWAGIQWATSSGDKQKVAAAKGRLTWGIIGLIIIFLSFFIINVFGHLFGVNLSHGSFNSSLAILSRQGGEMSLTIDELCPKFMLSKEVSHARPARSDHLGVGPFCATVFAPRLAPCPGFARGRDTRARGPHRDRRLAGDGAERRAPFYELSSGPEPGHMVGSPRESDSVGLADHAAGPLGRDARLRGRRYGRTPGGTEDYGERLLPGCRALLEAPRHPVFRAAMGRDDALGAGALEPAGMGVAGFDRALLA
jgi:hypothetical protein